jgi:hypothetical protein
VADRLNWLASHLDRPGYCDEAAEDAGGPPGDILAFVAWGMERELREVFGLVRTKLEGIAEDQGGEEAHGRPDRRCPGLATRGVFGSPHNAPGPRPPNRH